MVTQATVSEPEASASPASAVTRGVKDFTEDVFTLTELQWRLLQLDVASAKSRAVTPIGLIGAGISLAVMAVPMLLVAIAWGLHEYAGVPVSISFGAVAISALAIGGIVAYMGVNKVKHIFDSFQRSSTELERNVSWIKNAIKQKRMPWFAKF